jgi:hypothetical protein
MAKMIDVNAFIEEHCKDCPYRLEDSCTDDDPICSTIIDLKDFPTVDAVEVVHGRWVRKTTDFVYFYACSECGEPVLRSQWGNDFFSNYCPNCGAKMDGDGNV